MNNRQSIVNDYPYRKCLKCGHQPNESTGFFAHNIRYKDPCPGEKPGFEITCYVCGYTWWLPLEKEALE